MASAFRSSRSLQPLLIPTRFLSTCQPLLHLRNIPHRRLYSSTNSNSTNSQPTNDNNTTTTTSQQNASTSDLSSPSTSEASQLKYNDDDLAKKDTQIAEYKDLYIRARADYENLQKITTREKAQAKDYAIQSFAKDLVSNIDVLKLALDSVPESLRTSSTTSSPDSNEDARKSLADLWAGVSSTKTLLEQTLARFGVTPFDPTGEKFDPNKHEAMYQAPLQGKEPNSVLTCSKLGWMLRDRVLRPAQVGVVQSSE